MSSTQCLSCAISNLGLELRLFLEALWGITRSRASWVHHNPENLRGRKGESQYGGFSVTEASSGGTVGLRSSTGKFGVF